MAVKKTFSKNDTKAKVCLSCGRAISEQLKDDTIYTCEYCGQGHFVDFAKDRITLTVTERPEHRHRIAPTPDWAEVAEENRRLKLENENLKKEIQDARKDAAEWQAAADGLARMIEDMKSKEGK